MRDKETLSRIKSLVIPASVGKCLDLRLLQTDTCRQPGTMSAGANSIAYHPDWRKVRDEKEYDRMSAFGKALAWEFVAG